MNAFARHYSGITNVLETDAIVSYNGKSFKTQHAKWDTGATATGISERVVEELLLSSEGQFPNHTAGGDILSDRYHVDIQIPLGNMVLNNIAVYSSKIGEVGAGIDVLIGMDIISQGDFAVSNYNGQTTFAFRIPSQGNADQYLQDMLHNAQTDENET